MHLEETIAAIATAPGGSARGILRLSGPAVLDCLRQLVPAESFATLSQAALAQVVQTVVLLPDLATAPLPVAIYFWPDQRSYTRQPVAELHTLGSPPLLAALLRKVCAAGARLAAPGEFTMRAFLAGRIDLTQAEAVLGVIDAQGETELQTALSQLAGGLAAPLHRLRERLLNLLAHLEAGLDFVEEDIEFITPAELDTILSQAEREVAGLADQMTSRGEVQDALRVVLIGRPNAGKSSLFNALLKRWGTNEAVQKLALVADEAGTTRDYLSARVNLNGIECELIDTAGLEQNANEDLLAAAAQSMTMQQRSTGHLKLLCLDATRPLEAWEQQAWAKQGDGHIQPPATETPPQTLCVWTKCDVSNSTGISQSQARLLATSSLTGAGLDLLSSAIQRFAASLIGGGAAVVGTTLVRCQESLRLATTALCAARHLAQAGRREELVALEVRAALDALGAVVGTIYTEDVLDRVFSRFCIGK